MIICFNCSVETKDALDRLLATGPYRDYADAIAASIRNQVLMETEIVSKGAIVIGEAATAPAPKAVRPPTFAARVTPRRAKSPKRATTTAEALDFGRAERAPRRRPEKQVSARANGATVTRLAVLEKEEKPTVVPALFQLNGFISSSAPSDLADLPPDMWAVGQTVPLDRWMLGQQNRLLPAKANSRAIIHLFRESSKGLSIGETATRIASSALALGDYLTALDTVRQSGRDEALSIAFPTTGEGADKGCVRYANQFVVYQNGRGELSGLMVDLKLINVIRHRKERLIVPTRVAWEFARLPNAVLDGNGDGTTEKFSEDERLLLLRHIALSVPVEAFAYRAILEAVRDGSDTPDTIDAALKELYVAEDRAGTLSQSFLASQRSGAISRMSDLGLIERRRTGVRVCYAVTDAGRKFLEGQYTK